MKLFQPSRLAMPSIVFLVAGLILSWNLWNVGIASGHIDPILHFGAQDEATYTREAITMARDGGWMTPTFLDRWVFEKPPLLVWLSALSIKVLGIGRVSARLPSILAGALIGALCFSMVRRQRSMTAALAGAAMALTSQILFTMSRHNMTDILLAAAGVCAFAFVLRDPDLRETGNFIGFVIAAAAGMMAKSIAGILVVAVMFVVVALSRRRFVRALLAAISSVVLALPWFVYNYLQHRDWFLADMGYQILTVGTAGHQNAPENHLWFYLTRLVISDSIPLILALTAVPALVAAVRRREPAGVLAATYFVIYFAALMVFRFHSEQYLCWFVPSLILIAALYSPALRGIGAAITLAVVSVAFVVKAANPDSSFGVSLRSGTTLAAAPLLSRYCGQHRATDLYILGNDEFYSATLPLHHVHYGWIDTTDVVATEHPHLAYLGILIPASDLSQLESKLPVYRDRLRAWGLDSTRAVATGISARTPAELAQIIADHPESDFLVSKSILPDPEHIASHILLFSNEEFALIESKLPVAAASPNWTCEM